MAASEWEKKQKGDGQSNEHFQPSKRQRITDFLKKDNVWKPAVFSGTLIGALLVAAGVEAFGLDRRYSLAGFFLLLLVKSYL